MYVSSLVSLAPLTPGNVTEQGAGMNTRYSQPMLMFLQMFPEMRTGSSSKSAAHKVAVQYNQQVARFWRCWGLSAVRA